MAELCATQPLSLLANDAGVADYMPMAELSAYQASEVVHVKVLALTMLTSAALPGIIARGAGDIVKVAEVIAFSGPAPSSALPRRAVCGGALDGTLANVARGSSRICWRSPCEVAANDSSACDRAAVRVTKDSWSGGSYAAKGAP